MVTLRTLFTSAVVGVLCASATITWAQGFPGRPVRIISPYPAGISPDIAARAVAERLAKAWNQPVVVEPRPGANGFIAIGAAKRAAADGHELLLVGNAHMAINPNLLRDLPYNAESDFVPVSLIYRAPFFVYVAAAGPFRTIDDLVAAAKANPGRISYSTPYVGSPPHIGGALLAYLTGTQMLAVHFKEGPQMYTSIVTGDISFSVATTGSTASLVKAGRLKPLLIAAVARLPTEPEVPTAQEVGLPAGYEVESWVGLVAPSGTPQDLAQRISAEVGKALEQAEVQERLRNLGLEPKSSTPAAMGELIRTDLKRYNEIVKKIGITAE